MIECAMLHEIFAFLRVCMGIFTTALRNKKYVKFSKKKTSQCVACYLTAYFDEKSPFKRVAYFEVFNVHKKLAFLERGIPDREMGFISESVGIGPFVYFQRFRLFASFSFELSLAFCYISFSRAVSNWVSKVMLYCFGSALLLCVVGPQKLRKTRVTILTNHM